ncbi:MAG TPA: PAS domain S-box protein [Candidatus Solibacter sp.]|nr:PAS domain S-box protein [Candidatus Solibacter sp.]
MSRQSEQVVVFLVMTILTTMFAWIYLRDRQPRTRLWMLGWSAIYGHFTVALLFSFSRISPHWSTFLKISTLEVAGISFLLSVSEIYTDRRKRLAFVILAGAMSVIYTMCLVWTTKHIWIYPLILITAASISLLHVVRYYGWRTRYLYVFSLVIIPHGIWSVWQSLVHNPAAGLFSFLSAFFAISGLLYWRYYRRFSPGVITTSTSFLAWGGIFPLAQILHSPILGPESVSVVWDLPKYFVAIGMILTLFENQTMLAVNIAHKFQSLFEGNLAAVYVATLDGTLLNCNGAFVEMYGFSSKASALAARVVACYVDSDQREEFMGQLRADGRVVNYESQQRRQDGSIFWTLERATIVQTAAEVVIEGTALDITERKQSEIALRQSEERFSTIYRHSPMGCAITSLEGVFVDVNENLLRLLKLPADRVIGKTAIEVGFWKSEEERAGFHRKLRAEGSVQNLEIEFRDSEGGRHTGLYFGTLVRIGDEEYTFGMLLDHTQQRELEAKLLQAQKMDALGRLAGGVAHDFNNLLGVISGYAELLETKLGHEDRYGRYCTKIMEAIQRATGLTHQLLTFSRKEISRPAPLRPNQTLRELAGMLSRLIGEDIEVKVDLRSRGAIVIDKTHFEQIIFNIAVNSRDAMPHGGQLIIATENQTGPAPLEIPYVAIRIRDTGEGMDEETRQHAFEPFYTTKPMGRGTGLGLATVYGIVKEREGEISIESTLGRGTQISILLPIVPQIEEVDDADVAPVFCRGTGHILLVEDERELLDANAELLRSIGYSVRCAGSGSEALELIPGLPQLDLVITDVVMPKMNGREFADRLLQMRPQTKVLFVSGHTDDVVLQAGISTLGTPFLQKPFSLKQLGFKIQELLAV